MSTVDVVIPCYNYGRFLQRCVGSVLSQRGVDVRVLIIDDTSQDDTMDQGTLLARADGRVTYTRHATNKGHIATYNEGLLDWARADYSLLLSADDLLAPDALRRATAVMNQHEDVSLVYGRAIIITDDEQVPKLIDALVPVEYELIDGLQFLRRSFLRGNPVPTPAAVVRTTTQQRLGGYDRALPHTGDMEMWMRFAAAGSVGAVRAPQAFYRQHASSMSVQYYAGYASDRRERLAACEKIFQSVKERYPDLRETLEQTRQQFAHEMLNMANDLFESGDEAGCEACVALSSEIDPAVYRARECWKLRWKRRVGSRAWRRVRSVLNVLRSDGRMPTATSPGSSTELRQIGWIPDGEAVRILTATSPALSRVASL